MKNISLKQPSYATVDVFKFFAAILVVCIHTYPLGKGTTGSYFLESFCRIAVPFFFCFSSFIFFSKGKNIKSYVMRLMTLYCIWFVIELPIIYLRFFSGGDFIVGILKFLRGLLIHNTFYASWFITASWESVLIVYLILKYFNKKTLYFVAAVCACLSVSDAMYAGLFTNNVYGRLFITVLNFLCVPNSFVGAIPYVTLGYVLSQNSLNIKFPVYTLFLLLPLGVIEIYICQSWYNMTDAYLLLYPITFVLTCSLIKTRAFHGLSSRWGGYFLPLGKCQFSSI